MKKVKLTEEQYRNLLTEVKSKRKTIKITEQQYNKLLQIESLNDIDRTFLNKSDNKTEHIKNVNSVKVHKNISEQETNLLEDFINELYNINESGNTKYDKLIKVMEIEGLVENRKIKKEMFEGNINYAKNILEQGLEIYNETNDVYETVKFINETLDSSKDLPKEELFKNIVKNWLEEYRTNNDIHSDTENDFNHSHKDWYANVKKSEYYKAILTKYNNGEYEKAFRLINSIKLFNKIDEITNEVTTAVSSGSFVSKLGDNGNYKSNTEEEMEDLMDEATTTVSTGNSQYATPGFASSDFFGNSNKKGKAPVNKGITHKKTTYNNGKFVEFDDCVKLNNNKEAQKGGCSQGAVDNVVKYK